jgi:hypothetical protein
VPRKIFYSFGIFYENYPYLKFSSTSSWSQDRSVSIITKLQAGIRFPAGERVLFFFLDRKEVESQNWYGS